MMRVRNLIPLPHTHPIWTEQQMLRVVQSNLVASDNTASPNWDGRLSVKYTLVLREDFVQREDNVKHFANNFLGMCMLSSFSRVRLFGL